MMMILMIKVISDWTVTFNDTVSKSDHTCMDTFSLLKKTLSQTDKAVGEGKLCVVAI